MKNVQTVNSRLKQPETRQEALDDMAQWGVNTCLCFGTDVSTAYTVAGMFVGGLEKEGPLVKEPDHANSE